MLRREAAPRRGPGLPGGIDPSLIKVVSWDVDGTLYSIWRLKRALALRLILEVLAGRAAGARRDLEALRRYRVAIEATRARGGHLAERVSVVERRTLLNLERRWYGGAIERAGPRPGVRELLDWFHVWQIPQVVVSDYDPSYKLECLRLGKYFTSTYSGDGLGFVKPSPKSFERVAADFKIEMRQLLHIGDRCETDGAAAAAAGCPCLILGRDFRSFRALVAHLRAKTH